MPVGSCVGAPVSTDNTIQTFVLDREPDSR